MVREVVRADSAEPYLSKYLHQKGAKLGIPVSGNFELTARCNFNCKMCYVHLQHDVQELMKRELTADQWLSLASDARDKGLLFLLLTGGEPFLRKDFEQIYVELIKMGFVVSINTNASLYNEELRKLFRAYPPSRINVSLYGGSEETYERLCGNPSFGRVVQNLRNMKEDKMQVRLNVSLTPLNVSDMEHIFEISKELSLQAKTTSYMYPPVRVTGETGVNAGRFQADEAGRVMAKWNKLHDSKEIFDKRIKEVIQCREMACTIERNEAAQTGVMCRAGRSSFWVTWDGRMLPCGTMDIESSYPFEIGFEKAWQEVRERTAAIRLPKECTNCAYRKMCGVCAANCKAETGAFDKKPEYLCNMVNQRCDSLIKMCENHG